ncbi:hypothetical protein CHU98_g522 [Xylaria longipes]|nr:hypothetical protein CHU98_g522 [Xylaria longipes]
MTRSPIERLPEELLSQILELAMLRDSPFQIDWEPPEPTENDYLGGVRVEIWHWPPLILRSSTGTTDPLSTPTSAGCPHRRSRQVDHVTDWIMTSSTCRIFHRVGRPAFFTAKMIAPRSTLLSRLQQTGGVKRGFARILLDPACRKLLTLVRHVVIVDAKEQQPLWMLNLPTLLASHFPALARCTLVFGHGITDGPEWVTAAVAVSGPARETLADLLRGIGLSERLALEETMGTGSKWARNEAYLSRFIYPFLRRKAEFLRKKGNRADGRVMAG